MYQVKAQCGYEIQVCGKGENAPCRVTDQQNRVVYSGTYEQCRAWLESRAVKVLS